MRILGRRRRDPAPDEAVTAKAGRRDDRLLRSVTAIGRDPRDLVAAGLASGLLVAAAFVWRLVAPGPVELGLVEQIRQLVGGLDLVWRGLVLVGGWVGVAAVVAAALYLKRFRLAVELAAAVAASRLLALGIGGLAGPRPPDGGGPAFPTVTVTVTAVLVAVLTPYLATRWRGVLWVVPVLVAVAEIHLGNAWLLGALGGGLLGWGVASASHLVWGAPGRRTSGPAVRGALERAGIDVDEIVALRTRMWGPLEFAVSTAAGQRLRVEVVQRLHRRASAWYRLRRLLASVEVEDEPPLASIRHETEHEALVTVVAERAGLRTPPLVTICEAGRGAPLLVRGEITGRRLPDLPREQVDDALLDGLWAQVAVLAQARIAHHDLRARNVLVDADGRPWVLGLTFGKIGASPVRCAQDLAEALVSVASVVGVERAVVSACRAFDPDRLEAALPHLQLLALPRRIRGQLAGRRLEVTELRGRLAQEIDRPIPVLRSPVRPATVIGLLLFGAAVYALLPLLASADQVIGALRDADRVWLAVATVTGLAAIVASSVSFLGSSPVALPFWRTTAVQLAAAFTGRTTPGGIGFVAINVAFLERLGVRRSSAVGATVLNVAAGGLGGAVCCLAGLFVLGASTVGRDLRIPMGWPVAVAAAGVAAAAVAVLASPFGRRRVLRPGLRIARELAATLRRPVRATQLFGGALGHMVVSAAGLAASLAAFGGPVPVVGVLAVFMVAQTLGHLLPVPGGVGPVEAMMIGGLVALGTASAVAVSAVLVCRLLTYWLPVLPGIAAFRYLQHRRVI
ncbi:lysylphosphatidylglycerol synthase transmembrane domain-containing protein [Pseudonocardia sp. N23]|uniref:lysylphosphatidylglycerol synthase transmembrane domain-containing protein n=1 Tax=Pseudonocardia sp. N23 TaxID=1987376 RepID=UPI000C0350C6|nr:lysylphosphatidylglycerol synthase transmembrane domain-containing protein [Pseudonocardia sp. N23]GAY07367.1 probable conserved integral membrane protein [Pseudonocardia sp. N23]